MRGPRSELAIAGQDGASVASVANAHGFGSLSRFAVDYKARFHESPSETLRRGTVGRGAIGSRPTVAVCTLDADSSRPVSVE